MIVATAGHIDHGKTTLVKALTGVDTDRLPEEKARGISIDIGFAYWAPPGGGSIGFVDVPGHERFIHNMLAGVAAIDFALLVVAADDGVMPQTREHLAILDLFGVARGIVAITKTDRVAPARVEQVRDELAALLAPTALAAAPQLAVSAVTGAGVEMLRAALVQAAAQCAARAYEGRAFRFSIDRAFSVQGSGTVVTGTVLDGVVTVGDRLQVSPAGPTVRVRGLHKRGQATEQAVAGERCALNVAGADPAQAARGSWLLAPSLHAPTQRLDAVVRMLPGDRKPLRHWDPVHVHIGTADVPGRLVLPGEILAPGQSGLAQLLLDRPVAAARGDRFVLRDASAQNTLGGGSVRDPFALHPRGQREARVARAAALAEEEPAIAWQRLLDAAAEGVPVQAFRRTCGLTPAAMQVVLDASGAVLPGGDQGHAFSATHYAAMGERLLAALRAFHARAPQSAGMDTDRLLRAAFPRITQRERLAVLRALAAAGTVEVRGSLVRVPGYLPPARAGEESLWRQLAPLYAQWDVNVPLLREVAARSGIAEAPLRELLKQRTLTGEMVRIATDRFLPRPALARLAHAVVALAQQRGEREFTVAEYRDFTGSGRNLALEALEYFDRLGLTQRGGDARVIRCLDEEVASALAAPDWRPGALQHGSATPRMQEQNNRSAVRNERR